MQNADLSGPLPIGTSVLEASAGTGKTWTIAGLVARYVAEGHARIDQLLVVTFGRAATSELRSRVRERLVSVATCLKNGTTSDDPVVTLLTSGDSAAALARLNMALAGFDSATVATTHGFCEQVLRSLGVLSDLDQGTELLEGLDDLIAEVVDDLYLTSSGLGATVPPFSHEAARDVGRRAVGDPEAVLLPTDGEGLARHEFATAVRAEVERRKRALRLLSYDDQLGRVRAALTDPETGAAACARLRDRFEVVLVDEFQDTDPVQWDVLHTAFHGHRTLVVIGDPKQAIYGFRGADVGAYLAAKAAAQTTQTLGTNWRSDSRVLDGLGVLLRGAALGNEDIVVSDVAAGQTAVALGPQPDPTPVRLRWLPSGGARGTAIDVTRRKVARDVAAQVVATLAEQLTWTPRDGAPRPLTARDIAVLVRTGTQAGMVRDALRDVGVPTVLSGTSSVFATPAAQDWVHLLDALEQPHSRGRVRRAGLTSLVGLPAVDLDGDEGAVRADALASQLREWGAALAERGLAGLFAVVSEQSRLPARLLGQQDGERMLTDLRHVSEVLHREGIEAQLGLAGLVAWLRERVADTTDQTQERSRRLDTERAAVHVLTVHVSKGLEYPVVLVPYGWDVSGGGTKEQLPRGHDATGRRTLFVGGKKDSGYDAACKGEVAENAGEELRLLYVAMTRAVSRLVLWWAPSSKTKDGALHRLLLCADPLKVPATVPVPKDDQVRARLLGYARGGVRVDEVVTFDLATATLAPEPRAGLVLERFDRDLDTAWRRTSFTGLTRDAHKVGPSVSSEAEVSGKDDEADQPVETGAGAGVPLLMAELFGGRAFGTLVHEVLELADLSGDAEEALRAAVAERLPRSGLDLAAEDLVQGLLPAISTPLGPLAGGRSLRDLPPTDQLRELDFELPLAGGDAPRAVDVTLASVAALLLEHLPPSDPVRGYASGLATGGLAGQSLRGYLGGSIDVVLRVDGRYVVVDHKTNRLAPRDEPLTSWHYRQEAMDAAMAASDYPLQALLYVVALHRYLRWRQPSYDPAVHLGGVLYLFLRGMHGAEGSGVWAWQPPAALVVALSDLLAGRVS